MIRELFPDVITNNAVDRGKLGKIVLDPISGPANMKLIEGIVHPLVAGKRKEFYQEAIKNKDFLVVYDIPLLFENRAVYEVDYILVVTANSATQKERVMKRPGMTVEKFESILKKQVPDEIKREKADYLVHTDFPGYSEAKAQIANVIENIIYKNKDKFSIWMKRTSINSDLLSDTFDLKKYFDIILFDIDDTLVPLMEPINSAIEKLTQFTELHMPLSAAKIKANLRDTMNR